MVRSRTRLGAVPDQPRDQDRIGTGCSPGPKLAPGSGQSSGLHQDWSRDQSVPAIRDWTKIGPGLVGSSQSKHRDWTGTPSNTIHTTTTSTTTTITTTITTTTMFEMPHELPAEGAASCPSPRQGSDPWTSKTSFHRMAGPRSHRHSDVTNRQPPVLR